MFPYRLGLSVTQSSSVSLSPKERIMLHPFLASEFWVLIRRHWCNWLLQPHALGCWSAAEHPFKHRLHLFTNSRPRKFCRNQSASTSAHRSSIVISHFGQLC